MIGRPFLFLLALPLRFFRKRKPERNPATPRILVIRRNRMGDMLCTVPLLRMIRRHYPTAHLAVACDSRGEPIARGCDAVDEVIVLRSGWTRSQSIFFNATRLQNFDWVVAAKGGFDRRLARLTRLTNAAVRVGFEAREKGQSAYYTEPIPLPERPHEEHQIETMLRLGAGLGLVRPTLQPDGLRINPPDSSAAFARKTLAAAPFAGRNFVLVNLSSTAPLRFRGEDFVGLVRMLAEKTELAIGFVFAPEDAKRAHDLAGKVKSEKVIAVPTPGPLELAALLGRVDFFITPEGGAAHLAAAMSTPTLVLWSEGPFKKWRSRGPKQSFVTCDPKQPRITVEQVWTALEPFLAANS